MSVPKARPDFIVRCEQHAGKGRVAAKFRWRHDSNRWSPLPLRGGAVGVTKTALKGDAVDRQWLQELLADLEEESPTPTRTGWNIKCGGRQPRTDKHRNCPNQVAGDADDINLAFLLVSHAVHHPATADEPSNGDAELLTLLGNLATTEPDERDRIYLTISGLRTCLAYINHKVGQNAGRHTRRYPREREPSD